MVLLSPQEVRELDQALIAVYAETAKLRERYPAAKRIARPGIPAVFSESLVGHAAPLLFGEGAVADSGGTEADLRIEMPDSKTLLAEVKATGLQQWQEIKERDLARDFFLWVAFGHRYELGEGPIDVYILPSPNRYEPPRPKLTLSVFLADARKLNGFQERRFEDLEQLLGG